MNNDNRASCRDILMGAFVLTIFLYSGLSLLSIIEKSIRNFAGIYSLMIFLIIVIESFGIKKWKGKDKNGNEQ